MDRSLWRRSAVGSDDASTVPGRARSRSGRRTPRNRRDRPDQRHPDVREHHRRARSRRTHARSRDPHVRRGQGKRDQPRISGARARVAAEAGRRGRRDPVQQGAVRAHRRRVSRSGCIESRRRTETPRHAHAGIFRAARRPAERRGEAPAFRDQSGACGPVR